jgi:hypothetical protein
MILHCYGHGCPGGAVTIWQLEIVPQVLHAISSTPQATAVVDVS